MVAGHWKAELVLICDISGAEWMLEAGSHQTLRSGAGMSKALRETRNTEEKNRKQESKKTTMNICPYNAI